MYKASLNFYFTQIFISSSMENLNKKNKFIIISKPSTYNAVQYSLYRKQQYNPYYNYI